jgi:hypothetical protein
MRPWLSEELEEWRARLLEVGLGASDDDFIIPGAAPDGHYTLEQQHNFIRDIKVCGRVAAARDANGGVPDEGHALLTAPRAHLASRARGRRHQADRG